jgi:hypothetical protein
MSILKKEEYSAEGLQIISVYHQHTSHNSQQEDHTSVQILPNQNTSLADPLSWK